MHEMFSRKAPKFHPLWAGNPGWPYDVPLDEAELLRSLSPQRMDGEPIYALSVERAPKYDETPHAECKRTCIIHGDDLEDRTVHVGKGAEILWCPSCGKRRMKWDVRDHSGQVVARGSVGVQSATTT